MDWYNTVKEYYDLGFYTKAQVAVFVQKGKITPAQYQEITGDVYV
ncbi:XkdX family protein [Paenibacillus sp. HJGM_3]